MGIEPAVIARNGIQGIITPETEMPTAPAASGQLCLDAINGSTVAARCAGMNEANNPTSAEIVGAPTKATGSVVLT